MHSLIGGPAAWPVCAFERRLAAKNVDMQGRRNGTHA
jgi:hypothetical protein